jgi:hypothetical protein
LGEAKAPQHTAKFRCIGETHSWVLHTMNGALVRYSLLGYGRAGEAHKLFLLSFSWLQQGQCKMR